MNVAELVRRAAAAHPDGIAVIERGGEITYSRLWENIEALASGLKTIGIGEGSKVLILLPNCSEFLSALFGLFCISAVAVPVKPQTARQDLRLMVNNCSPEALIVSANILRDLLSQDPDLVRGRTVVLVPDRPGEDRILDPSGCLDEARLFRWADLLISRASSGCLQIQQGQKGRLRLASINYTYRGYGYPLGAMLTHEHYIDGALRYINFHQIHRGQRILLALPAAHIFPLIGCILVPILAGGTIVLPGSISPKRIFDSVQNWGVELLACVPGFFEFLAKHHRPAEWDLSSVRYGICGGEPLPLGFHDRVCKRLGFEILEGYGLTETMPLTCNPYGGNRPGTVGLPSHGVSLRIVDPRGDDCRLGDVGEIVVQCGSLMLGYHKATAETEEAIREGWFYTGDFGRLDEEGYVYFCGLRKAIRKVNGVTVDLRTRSRNNRQSLSHAPSR
jgi:long-chain acyl-CoA synthetase